MRGFQQPELLSSEKSNNMGIGAEDLSSGCKWWGGTGCGVGDSISGIVVSANKEQQRDFDTGNLMEWDNGDPRMESVIILSDTGEVDPEADNDDGKRALHLRGGNYEAEEGSGVAGEKALLEAINKAGIRCEEGTKLTAKITGMAKITGRGRNQAKLWTMKLEPAPAGIGSDDLFD
tara:strand:+ start:165 stop:692 length:528 start_codon:yes stop_codon:yes gene_type:complete